MRQMRLTVIGCRGVVGGATYKLLSQLGYDVSGVDIGDKPVRSDIAFICTPESAVTASLLRYHPADLYVVRSTVVPRTCQALENELGIHVLHLPEFLREATAVLDSFNPDRVLIGECCPHHGNIVESLLSPLCRPVIRSRREVTELVKLACNGWLAAVISYWNQIDAIADRLGVSGTQVGMLASTDPRIGSYGSRYHQQFGGKCLPKDTRHLIEIATELGVKPGLLEAVMTVNEEVGKGK